MAFYNQANLDSPYSLDMSVTAQTTSEDMGPTSRGTSPSRQAQRTLSRSRSRTLSRRLSTSPGSIAAGRQFGEEKRSNSLAPGGPGISRRPSISATMELRGPGSMPSGSVGAESGRLSREARPSRGAVAYDDQARALADRVALIMTRSPTEEDIKALAEHRYEDEFISRLAQNVVGLLPADQQLAFVFEATPAYWRHVFYSVTEPKHRRISYDLAMFPGSHLDFPQLRALQAIHEAESRGTYEWSQVLRPEDLITLRLRAREWVEPLNSAFRRKLPAIADMYLELCSGESAETRDVLDRLQFLCDQLAVQTSVTRLWNSGSLRDILCRAIADKLERVSPHILTQRRKDYTDRRNLERSASRGVGSFLQRAYYRVRDWVANPLAQLQRIYDSRAPDKPHLPIPAIDQAAELAENTVTVMKWHSAEHTGDEVVRMDVAETRSRLAKELQPAATR